MLALLAAIFPFLNPIGSVIGKLADAKVEQAKAETDGDKIRADVNVKTLEMRRDVMVAEAHNGWGWINPTIRATFALPVSAYYGKIFLWDKTLGWGSTDPLSPDLTWTARVIIGFYFLYETVTYLRR